MMVCPECDEEVGMINFAIKGRGDEFDIKFECPSCKHKMKESYPDIAFNSAETLAKGMLL